ncbi:RHS repeat-associated core domain-containing protein [Dokdonella sp.]|uniref:RHS repeat-associated core domain-containing protein n=2 Tax=Dokdonella sp. TaxID=2291710 RepID=UPI0027BA7A36|nr:RHS repeat-associated core domain-containing protein [Dokdonella sp.]
MINHQDQRVRVMDPLGSLRSVALPGGASVEYVIDGLDRRIGRKENGVLTRQYLYKDGLKPVAELDGNGELVALYAYAEWSHAPSLMLKGGKSYRIVSDHLGSPRRVIDSDSGAIVQALDYDEWGNVLADSNPGFQPFGFAGGLYDPATKLLRFGARDYDPSTGRWTAKDPIGFGGGDANLYAYVGGNPVSYIDPYGLWELPMIPQPVVDVAAGFGDGVSSALTFGLYSTADAREDMGIDGGVDQCSDAYGAAKVAGQVQGSLTGAGAAAKGLAKLSNVQQLRWLNQNRYLRFGPGKPGPGMPKVDMMRIGPSPANIATPTRAWWTHWRL